MTPEDIAYLRQTAQQRGYNSDDILKAINYESSGRENIWGGKNKNYYGLIQFGPNERAKYHIDTQNPSARNQIDGMFGFLHDRGFKPGMGLLDLYSTINAGSPGHYSASDGNGTVQSHVAKMMGMSAPRPTAPSGGGYSFALNSIPSDMPALPEDSPEAETAKADEEAEASRKSLASSLQTIGRNQQQQVETAQIEASNRAFQDFANQQHQQALGLLASNQRGLLGA